ncbi:hypothetical protein BGX28_002652 [Mortierella sp. GBA30]|nr:hypothetical protein BGX28_002652 [Mortierella sp. GBA30]
MGYIRLNANPSIPSRFESSFCYLDKMPSLFPKTTRMHKYPDAYGAQFIPENMFCPVPSAPASESGYEPPAYCTYKDMVVKAVGRVTKVDFKTCSFDSCKTSVSTTKSKKIEVHGDLKASGTIFKAVNLEASIGSKLETTTTYQTTDEIQMKKGDVAILVGFSIVLETSVGSLSVSAYDPNVSETDDLKDCKEDRYTVAPLKNDYLMADTKRTLWLSCESLEGSTTTPKPAALKGTPSKRQDRGEEGSDYEDECFVIGANGEMDSQPCPPVVG